MMFSVGEGERRSTAHTDIGIYPLWRLLSFGNISKMHPGSAGLGGTYCAALKHATADFRLGGEPESFILQPSVCLPQVDKVQAPLGCYGPALDELQHLFSHVVVEWCPFGPK